MFLLFHHTILVFLLPLRKAIHRMLEEDIPEFPFPIIRYIFYSEQSFSLWLGRILLSGQIIRALFQNYPKNIDEKV